MHDRNTTLSNLLVDLKNRSGAYEQIARDTKKFLSGFPPRKKKIQRWVTGTTPNKDPETIAQLIATLFAMQASKSEIISAVDILLNRKVELVLKTIEPFISKLLIKEWERLSKISEVEFQIPCRTFPFIGRDKELNQILRLIQTKHSKRIYNIHGMVGVGKTALATEIAFHMRFHFQDGIYWFDFQGEESEDQFFEAIASALNLIVDRANLRGRILAALESQETLLVFDQLSPKLDVSKVVPSIGNSFILTTHRRHLRAKNDSLLPFSAEELDSIKLIRLILQTLWNEEDLDIWTDIADQLGHLPMAIVIFAEWWAESHQLYDLKDVVNWFRSADRRNKILNHGQKNIWKAIEFSTSQLITEGSTIKQLWDSLWPFAGPFDVKAASAICKLDLFSTGEALKTLQKHSLLMPVPQGRFKLHPLIKDHIIHAKPDLGASNLYIMHYLSLIENSKDHKTIGGQLINCINVIQEGATHIQSQMIISAILKMESYLTANSRFQIAKELARIGLNLKPMPIEQAQLYKMIALAEKRFGNLSVALDYLKQAEKNLNFEENNSNNDLPSFHLAIGGILHQQRKYNDAMKYYKKGLSIAETMKDTDKQSAFLLNLGILQLDQGYIIEAQEIFNKVRPLVSSTALTKNRREVSYWQHVGISYWRLGKPDLAKEVFQTALRITKLLDNPELSIRIISNMSELYLEQQNFHEANYNIQKGLLIAKKYHFVKHLVRLKGFLARWRFAQDDIEIEIAQQSFIEAIKIANQCGYIGEEWKLLIDWGNALEERGLIEVAISKFQKAYLLVINTEMEFEAAIAGYKFGRLAEKRGNKIDAKHIGKTSTKILRKLQHPMHIEVEAWHLGLQLK